MTKAYIYNPLLQFVKIWDESSHLIMQLGRPKKYIKTLFKAHVNNENNHKNISMVGMRVRTYSS